MLELCSISFLTPQDCECLDPSVARKKEKLAQREEMETFQNDCAVICWKGDGFCDDENNNEGCEYDGGDCCNNDATIDGLPWNTFCSVKSS